jgi:hypothetical protein
MSSHARPHELQTVMPGEGPRAMTSRKRNPRPVKQSKLSTGKGVASASSAGSCTRGARSLIDRPMSLPMTLTSSFAAGLKRRMHNCGSRKMAGLAEKFRFSPVVDLADELDARLLQQRLDL